jgi:aryl-alcohol dehydrogenase-like predicted oxidoreductase
MEYIKINNTDISVSRIVFGTWAIGGWMWGGTEEQDGINTIKAALDTGINMIDTAPVYGLTQSEKMVGKVLKEYGRSKIVLATKFGLEWTPSGDKIYRNSTKERILKEIDDSLKRLQTDYVDLYQVHWPDDLVPFEETAEIMYQLYKKGKIRAIGVSNYSPEQMDAFRSVAPINTCQPQYNLFERAIEDDILPYCIENNITTLLYSNLCRGMLSGRMKKDTVFSGDDLRRDDPKFQPPRFQQYIEAVTKLDEFAQENYGKRIIHLAVRWILDQPGCGISIWGARRPSQIDPIKDIVGWSLDEEAIKKINDIVNETVTDPIGPEFLLPPNRENI